jgi:RHS repeat-associated protein
VQAFAPTTPATDANGNPVSTGFTPGSALPVQDAQGNFIIKIDPIYDVDLYPLDDLTAPQEAFIAPQSGTLTVVPQIATTAGDTTTNSVLVVTVKRKGPTTSDRLGKQVVTIANGVVSAPSFTVSVNQGDQLYFDISTRDNAVAAKLARATVAVTFTDPANLTTVPSALHRADVATTFPESYRGWSYVAYNGNGSCDQKRALGDTSACIEPPIDETRLVLTTATDPNARSVYPAVAKPRDMLWASEDDRWQIKAERMSSSRHGLDDLSVPTTASFATAAAVPRISRNNQNALGGGFFISISTANSNNRALLDFMDLNGDRYPDVVSSEGFVQYTRPTGRLDDLKTSVNSGGVRTAMSNGNTIGGPGSLPTLPNSAKSDNNKDNKDQVTKPESQSPSFSISGSLGEVSNQSTDMLVDINGDGLPDRVTEDLDSQGKPNGVLRVRLNLGYTFAPQPETWGFANLSTGRNVNASVSAGFSDIWRGFSGGANVSIQNGQTLRMLTDLNGDGLPDAVFNRDGKLMVALNTGAGFADAVEWSTESALGDSKGFNLGAGGSFEIDIPIPILGIVLVINPAASLGESASRGENILQDIDGDGYADHLTSSQDSRVDVRINRVGRTNLLKKVHRPLGATFDLKYTRDGNTFDLPQSRWLMTRVAVFDGHVGEGADQQVTTYVYTAPRHNRLEREFYGYGTVTERHHDTQAADADALFRSIQRDYRTDSYYTKGLLARELTSELTSNAQARPFLETLNGYVLRDVGVGVEPADGSSTAATIFPQLTSIERRFFEGGAMAQKATVTLNEYDPVGNISRFTDTGDAGAADDAIAVINYTFSDPACRASHIVGKPTKIVVTGNGAVMRNREATIDCTTGNATQVREHPESGQPAVTDITYSPSGNIQSVTGPANRNGQRYRLDYLYEPTVDTHVARITESHTLVATFEHDLRFGKRTTTTDVNGQKTTFAYDPVGRVDTIVGPYEQGTGQVTIDFDYAPVQTATSDAAGNTTPILQVPFAITRHIDKDADGALKPTGTIDTIVLTDGLKRVLQTKKDAAVHSGADSAPLEVMTVSGQLSFDAFGRTVAVRYPNTEPKGTNTLFNTAVDGVAATTMTYDVLDRNTRTTIPDGTSTTIVYGFGADRQGLTQFQTTVTDANENVKQTYKDVRELITTVKQFNQGATVWTSYAYDALKQVVRIVDDRNNVTSVAYDNLGRRTVIDNPDSGRTETRYDLASNVIAKITANLRAANQQINYDYDFKRLTAITYPSFPGNNVSYTYGGPGAAGDANGNRAGRISRITSQMGQEERFYGRQGEITKEVKTVNTFTTPNAPEVYTSLYQFDSWNRMMRMTYPDGEILTYAYDSGGLLNFAQGRKSNFTYGYINRLEYDKFEQRAFVEAGNNVRTRYAYDEKTRRLCGLTSAKGTGGTPICVPLLEGTLPVQNNIQNLLYVYDRVGNMTGLANSIPVPPPSDFGGPTRQTFVYDDLYRLTQASGTYGFNPSKTQTYSMVMAYDSIHNIVSKSQSDIVTQPSGTQIPQKKTSYLFNYAYSSSHPHAPTHIGNRTFTYDANGNQLGWDNDDNGTRRTIVWDEENRIQSLFDNGHEKTYKYDDQGQRIIKRGPQGETVYVNQYFTIRNKEIGTKHVFAGQTRVVSKLMKQDKPGANPQGKTPVEKDLYFFHPDHIGSSHYVTDTQGQLFQHLEYFPFGETWVEESSNTQRTPYLFTGKELDEETGLYYFGARYYDPRTSVWQSADPALAKFLPTGTPERDQQLPGMGGIYNSLNLGLYTYAHQNPVRLADPDGEITRAEVIAAYDARRAQGGVVPRTADDAFESAALRAFGLAKNMGTMRSGRVPDGVVGGQSEIQLGFLGRRQTIYPKSVIIDAKNVGSNIGPTAQIMDYLTDLQGTTQGATAAVPILMLITPEGVALSPSLITEAERRGVSILHFQMVTTQDGANPQIMPVLSQVVGRISPPVWSRITTTGGMATGVSLPSMVPRQVPLFEP